MVAVVVLVSLIHVHQAVLETLVPRRHSTVLYDITVAKDCHIILREGADPCSDIRSYFEHTDKNNCRNLDYSNVHTTVLQKLLSSPTGLSKLLITETFFTDCSLSCSGKCDAPNYKDMSKFHRSKFLETLLEILEDSDLSDEVALRTFEDKRDATKLTPEESLLLYYRAFVLKPNNALVTNKFGQILQYIGRNDLTLSLYETAVENGVWPNTMQRPEWTYVKGLTSKPWHLSSEFHFSSVLETHQWIIRKELDHFLHNQSRNFATERWNLNGFRGGEWTALSLKTSPGVQGYTNIATHFPETMQILRNTNEDFLQVKFSALMPGTHILPHTGPSNNRLRVHLCLIHTGGAMLRVGDKWKTWEEGKVYVFDSSWEHEVIHEGQDLRIVMILDIWHPECPDNMKNIY